MTSTEKLRLSVAQLTSVDEPSQNLAMIESLYRRAVRDGTDLVVFPENSMFFRIASGSDVQGLAESELNKITQLVEDAGVALMLTSPLKDTKGKFNNSTLLFEPGLGARVVYTKIHLFDVDVPGAPPVRESEHFNQGSDARILDFKGWKIGLSICYDLRFAELYLHYAQKVDLILIPSAFLVPTGEAHWHVLLRARAIEAQCFVAAPAQMGEHISASGQIRRTYGHSLVVDLMAIAWWLIRGAKS
jgi:deaminated glutathione amidase